MKMCKQFIYIYIVFIKEHTVTETVYKLITVLLYFILYGSQWGPFTVW